MRRVLVVDDHAAIRTIVRLALRSRFEVAEAEDAAAALVSLRTDPPDAMVLDVMMPGETGGFELCAHVKGDPALRRVHVVLLTARGQVADRRRAREAGADAFVVKPFSPVALAEGLEGLVERGVPFSVP